MHSRFHAGRHGRFTAHDAREHARDLMILGPRPPDGPSRPHRGTLPDLPPAEAGARPPRPSVLQRLRHLLRIAAGAEAAAILLSVAAGPPVGKAPQTSYMGPDESDETRHVPLV